MCGLGPSKTLGHEGYADLGPVRVCVFIPFGITFFRYLQDTRELCRRLSNGNLYWTFDARPLESGTYRNIFLCNIYEVLAGYILLLSSKFHAASTALPFAEHIVDEVLTLYFVGCDKITIARYYSAYWKLYIRSYSYFLFLISIAKNM